MENDASRFTPAQLAANEWAGNNWHDGLKIAGADSNYIAFWAFCAGAEFGERQRCDKPFDDLMGQIRAMKARSDQYFSESVPGSDEAEKHLRVSSVLKELERLGEAFRNR